MAILVITEKEAQLKRCCGPEGCGRLVTENNRFCIGSDCMAWSWWNYHPKKLGNMARGFCALVNDGVFENE